MVKDAIERQVEFIKPSFTVTSFTVTSFTVTSFTVMGNALPRLEQRRTRNHAIAETATSNGKFFTASQTRTRLSKAS